MSKQQDSGIQLSLVPEESQEHFRLLELPADLLNVLTSEHPPLLQLKSRKTDSEDGSAVLCTSDKTYNLRQVSTSNTVFVTQCCVEEDAEQSGLRAIAKSESILELLPTTKLSAVPYIKAALPTYTSIGHYSSKDAISKEELFANIPLSDAECESGWRELACFEIGLNRHSVIPSGNVILNAWQAALITATATGIDLTQPLDRQSQSMLVHLEGDWPEELLKAVLHSMATNAIESGEFCLNDKACAISIGRTLLKDRTDASKDAISIAVFKNAWADLLPEKWRSLAELTVLKGYYSLENGGKDIVYLENSAGVTTAANGASPAETNSTLGAKRKWHEKFRGSKKTA